MKFNTTGSTNDANDDGHNANKPTFYMQGMNGIAFVLLQVLATQKEEEEEQQIFVVYQFFRGIISRLLPHVFGICFTSGSTDHFDLFKSLMEVGQVVQEIVEIHLPSLHFLLEKAGISICIFVYKWFPTLFSDVSLTANHSQLRWETLLVIWDICFLMGLEGIFVVTLALFSLAESHALSSPKKNKQKEEEEEEVVVTIEDVSNILVHLLSNLCPEELVTSVCEVIESYTHPVILKLRNGHRRRLQLGYHEYEHTKREESKNIHTSSTCINSSRSSHSSHSTSTESENDRMTVRDLDSGLLFRLSCTGDALIPLEES
jgi:hypothetical protein